MNIEGLELFAFIMLIIIAIGYVVFRIMDPEKGEPYRYTDDDLTEMRKRRDELRKQFGIDDKK